MEQYSRPEQTLDHRSSASGVELLRLLRLQMIYDEANFSLIRDWATAFTTSVGDLLTPKDSAFLVEALFKYGDLSGAETVAQKRSALGISPSAFDTLASSYAKLSRFDFVVPKARRPKMFGTSEENTSLRVISFVYSDISLHTSGYTIRTHELLKESKLDVACFSRIGYPWAAGLLKSGTSHAAQVDGVKYRHRKGRITNQNDTLSNIQSAKREIQHILSEERSDIVHAASNFVNALPALLAARESGLPFVYEMRGAWELTAGVGVAGWLNSERYRLERSLETMIAKAADLVITLSDVQKHDLVGRGVPADRVAIVANGHTVVTESHATRTKLPVVLPDAISEELRGKVVLGYVGSIVRYEGLQSLIEMLAIGDPAFAEVVLVIAGDGPYLNELRSLVARLGVSDTVFLVGRLPKEHVPTLYGLIDVCVLPRLPEDVTHLVTPLKFLECLAHGKVVLASDVRAMAEQAAAAGYGELFRAGDGEDLRSVLSALLSDLDNHKQRYATAPAAISENFTWAKRAADWDHVLAAASRAQAPVPAPDPDNISKSIRSLFETSPISTRQDERLWTRIGRLTIHSDRSQILECVGPDIGLNAIKMLLVSGKTRIAKPIVTDCSADTEPSQVSYNLGTQPSGSCTVFVYTLRGVSLPASGSDFLFFVEQEDGSRTPLGPLQREVRDIVAVELNHRPEAGTLVAVHSNYPERVRFVNSYVPLDGTSLNDTFSRLRISSVLGTRFEYKHVDSGVAVMGVLPRLSGPFMLEFSPATSKHREQSNRISRVETLREMKRDGAYYVDLNRSKINILIAADINENLLDGSVVWLTTLLTALADDERIRLYVVSNSIYIPGSLTSDVFSRYNVAKIDMNALGVSRVELATVVRNLDRVSGGFDYIFIRGLSLFAELNENYLFDRIILYAVGLFSPALVRHELFQEKLLDLAARCSVLVFQNETTKSFFRQSSPDYAGLSFVIPPSVNPSVVRQGLFAPKEKGEDPVVVYSGKLVREYGVLELLSAISNLRAKRRVRLVILGNKFDTRDGTFRADFRESVAALGDSVTWLPAVSQAEVLAWVKAATAVWGWRHGEFENSHYEISTKMVEAIISATPIVLYPSAANQELLGSDYAGFAETADDAEGALERLLTSRPIGFAAKAQSLAPRFSSDQAYAALRGAVTARIPTDAPSGNDTLGKLLSYVRKPPVNRAASTDPKTRRILVAAHDFRFFEDIEALLLKDWHSVYREHWRSHSSRLNLGGEARPDPDVVLCDWCLGNAVWWSTNLPEGCRLVIRFHLQEMFTDFPASVDYRRVSEVVFVSPFIARKAQKQFGIPPEICRVVPISVSMKPQPRLHGHPASSRRDVLGVVGITPWRKRPDRAVELLHAIRREFPNVTMRIKGARPSEYSWMANRTEELENYQRLFQSLAECESAGILQFEGYDKAMERFYSAVGWIVSVSDFEGCHTSVAEGGVMGCLPLMTDWGGAAEVYEANLVQEGISGLVKYFRENYESFDLQSHRLQNAFARKFGAPQVYEHWKTVLFGAEDGHANTWPEPGLPLAR